jgi:predicted amidophosphoribosyltransferase
MIERLFRWLSCSGCGISSRAPLCRSCKMAIRPLAYGQRSIYSEIEGIYACLPAFERTQKIVNRWKRNPNARLRSHLFQMHPKLHHEILDHCFFGIVPIPQNQARSWSRGHASAQEVACFFSRRTDLPIYPILKLENTEVVQQTQQNRFGRMHGRNPFSLNDQWFQNAAQVERFSEQVLRGKEIRLLLVDDQITTGATLQKAALTLHELYPRLKIWAGALAIRMNVSGQYRSSESERPKDRAQESLRT